MGTNTADAAGAHNVEDGGLDSTEKEIIQLLSREGRPLTTEHICSKLGISKMEASSALYKLLKKGFVIRIYTESYDPTRPFDTASWAVKQREHVAGEPHKAGEEAAVRYAKLVLSVPLSMLSLRTDLLNRYEALDFHDAYAYVVEKASRELKIMCPIIDAYALYPLVVKIRSSKDLRIKILTELGKSGDALYLLSSLRGAGSIEIRDAARAVRYGGYERKAFGVHAKLIIADREAALIGSFNLSKQHYLVNFDIGFLIYDAPTVDKLSSIFDELWDYVSAEG